MTPNVVRFRSGGGVGGRLGLQVAIAQAHVASEIVFNDSLSSVTEVWGRVSLCRPGAVSVIEGLEPRKH